MTADEAADAEGVATTLAGGGATLLLMAVTSLLLIGSGTPLKSGVAALGGKMMSGNRSIESNEYCCRVCCSEPELEESLTLNW